MTSIPVGVRFLLAGGAWLLLLSASLLTLSLSLCTVLLVVELSLLLTIPGVIGVVFRPANTSAIMLAPKCDFKSSISLASCAF